MRRNLYVMASVLVFTFAARTAAAQDQPESVEPNEAPAAACPPGTYPTYPAQPQPYAYPQQAYQYPPQQRVSHESRFSPDQMSLSVGGGVAGFVRDRLSSAASTQGAWDARLTFGTRSIVGFEAGYLGSAGRTDDGVSNTLLTTQVTGALRLNATMKRIQPFILGGAGWVNMHRYADETITEVPGTVFNRNANGVVVPLAAGITGYLGKHGLVETRFTYDINAVKRFTDSGARPDMWIAELRMGYAF